LPGWKNTQLFNKPVVYGAVYHEFQRTDGMGNPFNAVTLPVGEVVHWINTPGIPSPVMMGEFDPVHDRVAQMHIRACHIDLGPEHLFALTEFTPPHPLEKIEVFFHTP